MHVVGFPLFLWKSMSKSENKTLFFYSLVNVLTYMSRGCVPFLPCG